MIKAITIIGGGLIIAAAAVTDLNRQALAGGRDDYLRSVDETQRTYWMNKRESERLERESQIQELENRLDRLERAQRMDESERMMQKTLDALSPHTNPYDRGFAR